jgi:sugar O-acyltransferase (sialic acid O-acetyltransferase NeuD family)
MLMVLSWGVAVMSNLALLGAGGHAENALAIIEDLNALGLSRRTISCIADDSWTDELCTKRLQEDVPHLADSIENAAQYAEIFIACIGYPDTRSKVVERALAASMTPAEALIHPKAYVNSKASVGDGSIVMQMSSIGRGSSTGKHCYIVPAAMMTHGTGIGNNCSLFPRASVMGDCSVGDNVMIGAGAIVLEGLHIGDNVSIGAGAVVTKDLPPGAKVKGIPAR